MVRQLRFCLAIFAALFVINGTLAAANAEAFIPQAQSETAKAQRQREDAAWAAAALLQDDPNNSTAWVVVARTRLAAGDVKGALEAARYANAYADSEEEIFAAALELAAANVLLERRIYAQFWLRRAAQVSPTEQLKKNTIQNFRAVRAQTPWQFIFSSSLMPSSNVNNGSGSEAIKIFGLPFILSGDAQALSGLESTFSSTARYQFTGFGNRPAMLSFSNAHKRVALSSKARKQAPEALGRDYAFDVFEVGYSQVVSNWKQTSILRLNTLLGHNRYGSDALTNYAKVGLQAQWPVNARSLTAVAGSIERQYRFDDDTRSAWVASGNVKKIWQVGSRGDVLGLTLGIQQTSSESIEVDKRAALLSFDYRAAEPVLGAIILSASINAEWWIYDASPYSANGRQDRRGNLSLTLEVPEWNYYGFAPALTFEASQTSSNVNLYDAEDIGVRISIGSIF